MDETVIKSLSRSLEQNEFVLLHKTTKKEVREEGEQNEKKKNLRIIGYWDKSFRGFEDSRAKHTFWGIGVIQLTFKGFEG